MGTSDRPASLILFTGTPNPEDAMKKVYALVAVLAIVGCGEKKAQSTPATNGAPAMSDSTTMTDSTMARDTSHSM
jgi:hypothetical protein